MWKAEQDHVRENNATLLRREVEMHGGSDLYAVIGRQAMLAFAKLWKPEPSRKLVRIPKNVSFVADAFLFMRPSIGAFYAPRAQKYSHEDQMS